MSMERERQRELELERATYSNCLLLGLDPVILGRGSNTAALPVGNFRHSNPKLGDQLLLFIISSILGPIQAAKAFDRASPFFEPGYQSRDFHRAVQNTITKLEDQGALPRNNSSVSSLATCCGPRFVELLWQLSFLALREVLKRTFPDELKSNPLPPPLTDVGFSEAASLLNVTKAKITLERKKFFESVETSLHEQTMWFNLAHEMTDEFRRLSAEEACLQKEIDDLRNKEIFEDGPRENKVSYTNENISKATRLWESLLAQSSQHEVLASGPTADLITQREHRYTISGSSLRAAMDHSFEPGDITSSHLKANDVMLSRVDDRSVIANQSVDISEIIRRWTHPLQRISKQSLYLEKSNDGEGPDLLRSSEAGKGHAESMAITLSEHQRNMASTQVLNDRMKAYISSLEKSILEHTEEVNMVSSHFPELKKHYVRHTSPGDSEKTLESDTDEVASLSSKLSSVQINKGSSSSPPALKLPQLFDVTPNFLGEERNPANQQIKNLFERKSRNQPHSTSNPIIQVGHNPLSYAQNIKRSVRETAVPRQSCNLESSSSHATTTSEHFFLPISESSHVGARETVRASLEENPYPEFVAIDSSVNGGFVCASDSQRGSFESLSPPSLMNLDESCEDLLAPLTDSERALIQDF